MYTLIDCSAHGGYCDFVQQVQKRNAYQFGHFSLVVSNNDLQATPLLVFRDGDSRNVTNNPAQDEWQRKQKRNLLTTCEENKSRTQAKFLFSKSYVSEI